eukprot:3404189-Rhodomonas_salina.2
MSCKVSRGKRIGTVNIATTVAVVHSVFSPLRVGEFGLVRVPEDTFASASSFRRPGPVTTAAASLGAPASSSESQCWGGKGFVGNSGA